VVEIEASQRIADAVVGQRGEGRLAKLRRARSQRGQRGRGRAEFLRELFGEDDGQTEPVGGGDGELAAPQEGLALGQCGEEDRLHVHAQEEHARDR
jgi:hypothetical protein